ncbi:MAG: hypothetical protein AAF823_04310 [Planctomycetota bacterium]
MPPLTRWHLIDGPAPLAAVAAHAAAAAGEPALVIGSRRLAALVQAAGVPHARWISAPLGRTALARFAAAAAIRRIRGLPELVGWSPATIALARALARPARGLHAAVRDAAQAPPLTDDPATRAAVRQRWGVDDATAAILLLPTAHPLTDAYDAALALGLADEAIRSASPSDSGVAPRHLRLVVAPAQPGRLHAHRLWQDFGRAELLIADPAAAMPWQALPACDAAIDLGPTPDSPPHPWRPWLDAMHRPIVGPAHLPSRTGPVVDARTLAGRLAAAVTPSAASSPAAPA